MTGNLDRICGRKVASKFILIFVKRKPEEHYLLLVHFDQTRIDFHPGRHICDAPQLVGVLPKVPCLHLADVVDAANEHKLILIVADNLFVHEFGRIEWAVN